MEIYKQCNLSLGNISQLITFVKCCREKNWVDICYEINVRFHLPNWDVEIIVNNVILIGEVTPRNNYGDKHRSILSLCIQPSSLTSIILWICFPLFSVHVL